MRRSLTQRLHKSLSHTLKPSLTDRSRSSSLPPTRTPLDGLPPPPTGTLPSAESKITTPPSSPSDTVPKPTHTPTSSKKTKQPTSHSKRKPRKTSSPKKTSTKKLSSKTSPKKSPSAALLPIVHNPDGTLSDLDGNPLSLSEDELSQEWFGDSDSDV